MGLPSGLSLTSQKARFPGYRTQSSKPRHLTLAASSPAPTTRPPTRAASQWFSPPPFRASKVGPLLAPWGEPEARRRDPSGAFRREAPIGRECVRPPLISPPGTPAPPKSRRPWEKPGGVSRGPSWARGVAAAQVSVPRPGGGLRGVEPWRWGGAGRVGTPNTDPLPTGRASGPPLLSAPRTLPVGGGSVFPTLPRPLPKAGRREHRDPGRDNSNTRSTSLMTPPRKPGLVFPRPALMLHSVESKHPPGRGC